MKKLFIALMLASLLIAPSVYAENRCLKNMDKRTRTMPDGTQGLDMDSCKLTFNDIANVMSYLEKHPAITLLNLSRNAIGSEGIRLVAHGKTLTGLFFMESNLGDEEASELAKSTNLKFLEISENNVGDTGIAMIAKMPALNFLGIYQNSVTDAGMTALAKNKSLQTLLVSGPMIGDKGASALAKSNLAVLSFYDTNVGNTGIAALAQMKTLKALQISFGKAKFDQAGLGSFAKNNTLEVLAMEGVHLNNESATAISNIKALREAYLSQNKIGDAGASALAKNTSIKKLDLHYNRIGNVGAFELAKTTTLKTLDVACNKIDQAGINALKANPYIEELNVDTDPDSCDAVKQVKNGKASAGITSKFAFKQHLAI